jgi:hypothetical protein
MLFVRIVEAGININGINRRKVYIYKPTDYKPEQFNYASVDDMKKLDFGRVYKEHHYIMTMWEKWEILERLTAVFGNEYNYIFE